MNELDEVVMVGSAHNDYPNGDFVCHCYECGVDFHGPLSSTCYQCRNRIEPVVFTGRPILITCVVITALVVATLLGVYL